MSTLGTSQLRGKDPCKMETKNKILAPLEIWSKGDMKDVYLEYEEVFGRALSFSLNMKCGFEPIFSNLKPRVN